VLEIDGWKRFYEDDTPKLFEVSSVLKEFIKKELPKLSKVIAIHGLTLEPLITSPFFTLFANLISIDDAMRVFERFILLG
jgi:hypothetical protein